MTYYHFLITRNGERFFTWQLSDLEGFRPNKRFQRTYAHMYKYVQYFIFFFFFRETTTLKIKNVQKQFFINRLTYDA